MFARAGAAVVAKQRSRRKRKSGSPPARRESKDGAGPAEVASNGADRMESLAELVSKMKAGESNLLVVSRVRPLSNSERVNGETEVARVLGGKMVILLDPNEDADDILRKHRSREKRYAFDHTFGPTASQSEVYEKSCKFLLEGVLNGYNATVFAYGATGAGKTFTMAGTEAHPGVMAMTMSDLFAMMDADVDDVEFQVTVSYIELYNEAIRDLLVADSADLELREDADGNSVVCGMQRIRIASAGQMMTLLQTGNSRRTQESTGANATSSRSHAILEVQIDRTSKIVDKDQVVRSGRLFMIDLAGSERASSTMNNGQRMVEGQHINRSLLALGNCINSLGGGHRSKYVNFRDSKLTRILKESLGGNCRTVMIACISPARRHFEETYNTMNYANRAKNIKTTVMSNESVVHAHVAEYGKIIEQLKGQVSHLQEQLQGKKGDSSLSVATAQMIQEIEEACQQQVMTQKKLELLLLKENDIVLQRDTVVKKLRRRSPKDGASGGADAPHIDLSEGELQRLENELKTMDELKAQNNQTQKALAEQSATQQSTIQLLSEKLENTPERQQCKYIVKIHDLEIQNLKLSFMATAQRKEVAQRVESRNADLRDRIIAEQKLLLDKFMPRPSTSLVALYSELAARRSAHRGTGGIEVGSTDLVLHGVDIKDRPSSSQTEELTDGPSPTADEESRFLQNDQWRNGITEDNRRGTYVKSEFGGSRSTRYEGAPLSSGGRRLSFDSTSKVKSHSSNGRRSGSSRPAGKPSVSKSRVQSGVAVRGSLERESSRSSMEEDDATSTPGSGSGSGSGNVQSRSLSRTYSKGEMHAVLSQTYSKAQPMSSGTQGGTAAKGNVVNPAMENTPGSTNPSNVATVPEIPSSPELEDPLIVVAGKAAGSLPPWQRGMLPLNQNALSHKAPTGGKVKLRGAKPRTGQQRRNPRTVNKGKGRAGVHPAHVGAMLGLSIQSSPYASNIRKPRGAR